MPAYRRGWIRLRLPGQPARQPGAEHVQPADQRDHHEQAEGAGQRCRSPRPARSARTPCATGRRTPSTRAARRRPRPGPAGTAPLTRWPGVAQHEPAVVASSPGGEPGDQRGVDLEAVAAGEPLLAEPGAPAPSCTDGVADEEDGRRSSVRRGRGRRAPARGRRAARRRAGHRPSAGSRAAPGRGEDDAQPAVQQAQRVGHPPDRPEQQARRHQPDPEGHVERPGREVAGGLGAARRARRR